MQLKDFINSLSAALDTWMRFWTVFHLYAHIDNLEGLKAWSKQKKLGVFYHYSFLHTEMSMRLSHYSWRYPTLTYWAEALYGIKLAFIPEPAYHTKGTAAQYKLSNLRY